jgi:pyruvate/2-oxoglutarate dehydrogenase complex dihydrolipoamide dehydrogenase (E3) component
LTGDQPRARLRGGDYELIVIGGGAAGISAARTAARHGLRPLLVQAGRIGGECTFTGCVPSKSLIEAAAAGHSFAAATSAMRSSIETIAAREADDVLAREGIDVLHGWATFRSRREVEVDGASVRARRVVIATGSRPAVPAIDGLRGVDYLTNETVFDLEAAPASLAILGGGAMGCELAQTFARFGSEVTVIETEARLLPREEPEASTTVAEALGAEGVEVRAGRTVTTAEAVTANGAVRLRLDDHSSVEADRLLIAVGRAADTDGLGLDAAGVATDRGFVVTDDSLATSGPGIWAAGDVAGKLQLTHAAYEMGRIAATNALSPRWRRRAFDPTAIPSVVFTAPEVARVGLTEQDAVRNGARVAFLPMSEVDRAVVSGQTAGFVKLIAGPRPLLRNLGGGRILGATVVAARAGEAIHEPALAMRTAMFTGRVAQTVHAYPTWSVAIQQAAAQFFFEIEGRRARPSRPVG